jgi:hypothetical protein
MSPLLLLGLAVRSRQCPLTAYPVRIQGLVNTNGKAVQCSAVQNIRIAALCTSLEEVWL